MRRMTALSAGTLSECPGVLTRGHLPLFNTQVPLSHLWSYFARTELEATSQAGELWAPFARYKTSTEEAVPCTHQASIHGCASYHKVYKSTLELI
ncbi:hypothetical protein L218DRAFT_481160 [Marasmius fiardii PR-910]|nr:hypothetical protein L218DRAFT_481160 [Marasmius fiardii PR-910]